MILHVTHPFPATDHANNVVRVDTVHPGDRVDKALLWPDGPSRDYSHFHGQVTTYAGQPMRRYDPYSAYQGEDLPPGQVRHGRAINNLLRPSTAVMSRMVEDLERLSQECGVVWWDSAIQCFPEVAKHLKRLFKIAVLSFGDDLPWSSATKTFPVARYFDVLLHAMWLYDFESGKTVPEVYAERGLHDCRFIAWGPMENVYTDEWFERKLATIPDVELCWLGNSGLTPHREHRLRQAESVAKSNWVLRGPGMAGGLWPDFPSALYAQSMFGLNIPEGSFFNGRFADLCMSGTVMVAHDPWGELPKFGFFPGEHFVPYDSTTDDLVREVSLTSDWERIARAARARFLDYRREYDDAKVFARVLADYDLSFLEAEVTLDPVVIHGWFRRLRLGGELRLIGPLDNLKFTRLVVALEAGGFEVTWRRGDRVEAVKNPGHRTVDGLFKYVRP